VAENSGAADPMEGTTVKGSESANVNKKKKGSKSILYTIFFRHGTP
jgi:hypothetical protein